MTPFLFHGPTSRDRAVELSEREGRPVAEPLGDAGLKVEEARQVIELSESPGIGDKAPTLVLGPLNKATPEASDALLKTLEDLSEAPLKIILWADHLSGVSPTIRSRTRPQWCPEDASYQNPLAYLDARAQALCKALKEGDASRILGCLEEAEEGKDWPDLLEALCEPLAREISLVTAAPQEVASLLRIWLRVRRILDGRGSSLTVVNALLPLHDEGG